MNSWVLTQPVASLANWPPKFWDFESIDSTNLFLKRAYQEDPQLPDFTTVQAKQQSAGQGRYQRQWLDVHDHSMLFSTLVSIPTEFLDWATLLVPLAWQEIFAFDSVRSQPLTNGFSWKWPNDLFWDGKKAGGVLSELLGQSTDKSTVMIGIGINIGAAPQLVETENGPQAAAGFFPAELSVFQSPVLPKFLRAYQKLIGQAQQHLAEKKPVSELKAQWQKRYQQRLAGTGKLVTVRLANQQIIQAHQLGIDENGSLRLLEGDNRKESLISCADVALPGQSLPPSIPNTLRANPNSLETERSC